jgi:hypothetical protein
VIVGPSLSSRIPRRMRDHVRRQTLMRRVCSPEHFGWGYQTESIRSPFKIDNISDCMIGRVVYIKGPSLILISISEIKNVTSKSPYWPRTCPPRRYATRSTHLMDSNSILLICGAQRDSRYHCACLLARRRPDMNSASSEAIDVLFNSVGGKIAGATNIGD